MERGSVLIPAEEHNWHFMQTKPRRTKRPFHVYLTRKQIHCLRNKGWLSFVIWT